MTVTAKNRKRSARYVEVVVMAGEGPNDMLFRAMVVPPGHTAGEAVEIAVDDARRAHPQAQDVQEFMSRALTPEQSKKIEAKIRRGIWRGWPD